MANSTGDRLGAGPHARPVPEQGALGHRRGMFSTLSLYVDRILHVSMPLETWEMYRSGGAGPCAYLHTWKLHVFPVNGILPQRNLSKPSAKLQPTSSFSNKRDVDVNPRKYTAKHLQVSCNRYTGASCCNHYSCQNPNRTKEAEVVKLDSIPGIVLRKLQGLNAKLHAPLCYGCYRPRMCLLSTGDKPKAGPADRLVSASVCVCVRLTPAKGPSAS